jgi:hypothetical protein
MKYFLLITLLLFAKPLFAQRITGVVIDNATNLPITNATVSTPRTHTFTSPTGSFNLAGLKAADTLTVTNMGYRTYRYVPGYRPATDTLRIYLDRLSIMLKDVQVIKMRDLKADSTRNRKQFASVYNHRSKTVMGAFAYRDFTSFVPYNNIDAPKTTTAIGSVNLLSVINLLTNKNERKTNKLRKTMLKDEEIGYVDRVFSRQKVAAITALKGDSLQTFIIKYRPSLANAQKMSSYELMMYIKKSYSEFKQSSF